MNIHIHILSKTFTLSVCLRWNELASSTQTAETIISYKKLTLNHPTLKPMQPPKYCIFNTRKPLYMTIKMYDTFVLIKCNTDKQFWPSFEQLDMSLCPGKAISSQSSGFLYRALCCSSNHINKTHFLSTHFCVCILHNQKIIKECLIKHWRNKLLDSAV